MFCKQCGTEIKDGVAFCPVCGVAVPQQSQPPQNQPQQSQPQQSQPQQSQPQQNQPQQNQPPQSQPQPQNTMPQMPNAYGQPYPAAGQALPKKNNKKIFFIIGGAAAALVIIIAVIITIVSLSKSGNHSCSAVVDKMSYAMNNGSADTIMEILPPDYVRYCINERYDGDVDDFKDSLEDTYDISSSFAITYDMYITSEQHCTDSKSLKELNDYYKDRYESAGYITDVAKCRVESSFVYAGLGTPSTDTDVMYFVCINGQWYLDASGRADDISSRYFK